MHIEKLGTKASARALMLASAALLVAGAARAEEKPVTLEEVVVEARKVKESVQDIPVTVNVLTGDALAEKGVTQLSNVANVVPNVVWVDGGGGTFTNKISMRGIFSNATSQGFDPGVAVYVDDVYVGNQFGFNSALLDIDRVEVLKGPQGTLFGRNAAVGAISVHTTRPSTSEASTILDGRLGNFDLREGKALVNIPLSENVALKVSGIYRDRDGFVRNSVTGRRNLNDEHLYGGRVQLLVRPSNELELVGTVEYFKNDDHQSVFACFAAVGALPCPNATIGAAIKDGVAADNNSTTKRESWGATLKADWAVTSKLNLTSVTAYSDLKVHHDLDQDFSPVDFIRSGTVVPKDWQFSEELRLATDQAARLRGVFGLYYFYEERTTDIPFTFTTTALASLGVNSPTPVRQVTHSEMETTSLAAFGQAQFDILPTLTAELGYRYGHDDKDFLYQQTESAEVGLLPPFLVQAIYLVPFPLGRADASFDKSTYTASLSWKPQKGLLTYVRYATGFKAGGFQAATNSPNYRPLTPFRPENSTQVEAGVKSELADGRVRLNVAAFHTSYRDTQVQITDPATKLKVIGNLGSGRSNGVEFELAALLTQGLTLDANLGLQRSKFVSGAFSGRPFQYSPRSTGAVTLTYQHDLVSGWRGIVSGTAAYRSAMNLSTDAPGARGFLRSPAATMLNGQIGVQRDDDRLGVYLWGSNLTDTRRPTEFFSQGPVAPPAVGVNAPRTYGIELKAKF